MRSAVRSGAAPLSDLSRRVTRGIGQREKTRRRADLDLVGRYYADELAALLERLREGFRRYDAGELSVFELDDLVHRYKRATRELEVLRERHRLAAGLIARTLEEMHSRRESVDWWERGNPPRDA